MIEITLKSNKNIMYINSDYIGFIYTEKGDTVIQLTKKIMNVTMVVVDETELELRNSINRLKYGFIK